jgi:hypothetical protein
LPARALLTSALCSIVTELFNTLDGKVITVFGFAFKADTSDTRESPAIDICKTLVAEGARVHVQPLPSPPSLAPTRPAPLTSDAIDIRPPSAERANQCRLRRCFRRGDRV